MVALAFLDLQDERDHLTKKNDFQKLAYFQLVEWAVLVKHFYFFALLLSGYVVHQGFVYPFDAVDFERNLLLPL